MFLGEFNWIDHLNNVIFNYNNTKHTATHCKPFVLFKGFDMNISSSLIFNDENNIQSVRLRIMEYVDSYRREYNQRQYDNLMIGTHVIVARPYSLTRSRRQNTFESLYFLNQYLVIGLEDGYVKIEDLRSGEIKLINRRFLKVIQNPTIN
ncbi:hypothetical protein DMUE_3303 [Dictyocoela muelleri]|nr:hypothetical protein DMUE_3303 [Dictyocoela muelleri]